MTELRYARPALAADLLRGGAGAALTAAPLVAASPPTWLATLLVVLTGVFVAHLLGEAPTFAGLPADAREAIVRELGEQMDRALPAVNEDTMPGELANCMAGRVANLFDLHGPNYVCDAACASALAAIDATRFE